MKITIEKTYSGLYKIRLSQGVQSFDLEYRSGYKACTWYAKMFKKALDKHNQEVIEKFLDKISK